MSSMDKLDAPTSLAGHGLVVRSQDVSLVDFSDAIVSDPKPFGNLCSVLYYVYYCSCCISCSRFSFSVL